MRRAAKPRASAAAPKPAAAPAAAPAADEEDFSSMTVAQLREACKTKGLETTGTKAVLLSRLQGADSGAAAAAPAAAAPAPAKRGRKNKHDEEEEEAKAEEVAPNGKKGKTGKAASAAPAAAEPQSKSEKMAALKAKASGKLRKAAVDSYVPGAGSFQVHSSAEETFDVMLNQTNISANNNKYYVIQVIKQGGGFYCWTRWGRVGEPGQNKLDFCGSEDAAIDAFKKKFKDKTGNNWDGRDNFQKKDGKYDIVDMDDGGEEETTQTVVTPAGSKVQKKVLPSKLMPPTAKLVNLLFDHDMFREAMANMEIDVQKMPLGKISKAQIAKGYEVLEEMKDIIISGKGTGQLQGLSSKFYTIVPHSFGRSVPPVINTMEMLQKKMDMLEMLGDIELALGLETKDETDADEVPNPIDLNYKSLNCDLELVDRKSREYEVIMNYLSATMEGRKLQLQEIWKVNRHDEGARFKQHDDIKERKLLWHGTNVAVVAAILKSGLRIMPHSGGRVGRGIYFASENSKSAGYVRTVREEGTSNIGIMFLAEVALGKEHHITIDDYQLKAAPAGYQSIVAKGSGEPDPSKDTTLKIDGHTVTVPQGKRIPQPQFSGSNFDKSEYLIYKESQHRIRYLLKLKF